VAQRPENTGLYNLRLGNGLRLRASSGLRSPSEEALACVNIGSLFSLPRPRSWIRSLVALVDCGVAMSRLEDTSSTGPSPVRWVFGLPSLLLLAACASAPVKTAPPEGQSHIYPLPLDNVLAQTTTLLQKKGWVVKRAGNSLLLNWQGGATNSLITYRVFGQSIDAGLSVIRVERLVATTSTSFSTDHPVTPLVFNQAIPFTMNPEFAADPLNDSAAGTAPPPGSVSPGELARPSPWVVSGHRRDAALELELQREIDPAPVATAEPRETPAAPSVFAETGHSLPQAPGTAGSETGQVDTATPATQQKLADMAGIWEGTFTFRGNIVGTFSGEVTVAVDGRTVEVDDFCPQTGGTMAATGANTSAAWEGSLTCSAIPITGCPTAALNYNFAHATMNDDTLTVVAAGTVDTPPGCSYSGGALSVAFIAQKADYVHIAVARATTPTSCLWPSDWEDFNSKGSMSMPEPSKEDSAYLGVIRAKGNRLTDIQKLLRNCHQVVLLHGQPVLMKLAATRPRHD
jgi:hypothetical protein